MDKVVRDVRNIDQADRQALEHVIGQSLRDNQQVVIDVVNIEAISGAKENPTSDETAGSASEPGRTAQRTDDEIPDWWNVYEGLSDEEIDRLDLAIRERANLTRESP
ncbi:MAG TPA: hypothetical protein VMR25_24525 [Planctomycetaceae bacterium]|jgi:hypothetical protein|nr:hypothetical protein [Planctomycetaceae bacterium]